MEQLTLRMDKKRLFLLLGSAVLFGLLIRLLFGYYRVHYFDIDYYIDWSNAVVNHGIFQAYQFLSSRLDYPPVFLFFLYPTGWLLNNPVVAEFENYKMLALKLPQICFDIATIILIYVVLKKQNKLIALFGAWIWALNPALIFNCAVWGQTDSMMIFFLLLAFWLLSEDRPVIATIFYAVAGLAKFQSLYFAPVFLLFLFYKRDIKKSLLSFAAGIGTGILIFLPFMLYSGILLPFEVYLGGLGKWTMLTFNAYNFYGAIGLNNVSDSTKLFGVIPWSVISTLFTVVVLALLVWLFLKAQNKCIWIFAFLIMESIFMFGGRMHERYQVPVLIFLLIAALRHRSGKLFGCFAAITTISFFNQFLLFEHICTFQKAAWSIYYDTFVVFLSILNLVFFFITLKFCLDILQKAPRDNIPPLPAQPLTEESSL